MPDHIPGGFILLARKTQDNDVLAAGPPLYTKLWVWMLMQAFWKNGDKYLRGQFRTTIGEMREAMSWTIGYRKQHPKICHIRRAYEAFTKSTMITTTKSTRGMVITICNYNKYQNPKSYEEHNEEHNEETTKSETVAHDREEREYKKKEKEQKIMFDLTPNDGLLEKAKQVIEYLNKATNSKFRPVGKNVDLVRTRLREGFTVEDCVAVIDGQKLDPYFLENPKYFRPSTLFGSKFEGYLSAAPKQKAALERDPKKLIADMRAAEELRRFVEGDNDQKQIGGHNE